MKKYSCKQVFFAKISSRSSHMSEYDIVMTLKDSKCPLHPRNGGISRKICGGFWKSATRTNKSIFSKQPFLRVCRSAAQQTSRANPEQQIQTKRPLVTSFLDSKKKNAIICLQLQRNLQREAKSPNSDYHLRFSPMEVRQEGKAFLPQSQV